MTARNVSCRTPGRSARDIGRSSLLELPTAQPQTCSKIRSVLRTRNGCSARDGPLVPTGRYVDSSLTLRTLTAPPERSPREIRACSRGCVLVPPTPPGLNFLTVGPTGHLGIPSAISLKRWGTSLVKADRRILAPLTSRLFACAAKNVHMAQRTNRPRRHGHSGSGLMQVMYCRNMSLL